tara:strand:+ start:285 stop:503 length:219 start_codon:yes stop_codon:yes gene_type:complete
MKEVLKGLDVLTIFKDKRFGDLKRWSAKRSIGGVIVMYSLSNMNGDITWQGITLVFIGVLPLCLSMFESRKK